MDTQVVLDFWFAEKNKAFWFAKSDDFDNEIRQRFLNEWQQARSGELWLWRKTLDGRLAEIILLDQFSRNLFRNSSMAFEQDAMALALSQEAVGQSGFAELPQSYRKFMLMPMMHSESALVHEQAVPLFEQFADQGTVDFELKHKAIIDRFGRYPHRNSVVDRQSSAEELAFLQQAGSSF